MGLFKRLFGKKEQEAPESEEENLELDNQNPEEMATTKKSKKVKAKGKKVKGKGKGKGEETPVAAPATAYPDIDVTVLGGRQDLIPKKYIEQRLNAWSTQGEKLQFLWDLGYRKISRDIFREVEFSETAPVALTSSGADYGKFRLAKEIGDPHFNLINTEEKKAPAEKAGK